MDLLLRANVEAVSRFTGQLRSSGEPYWHRLRERLASAHDISADGCLLLDLWSDGDAAWLVTDHYVLIDFDYDFSAASHIDNGPGRFSGWMDRSFARDQEARQAFDALVERVGL